MNMEIFLPGLDKPVLVSEDKFGKVMDLVNIKFSLNNGGVINFKTGYVAISLSRYIINCPRNRCVDHKNHSQFDLTNENLRIATRSQNNANRRKKPECSSKYKGVCWDSDRNKWVARINFRYKEIYLGSFGVEAMAAEAYNIAALKYFGEFAYLNIIEKE